jgi:hypothetical protein
VAGQQRGCDAGVVEQRNGSATLVQVEEGGCALALGAGQVAASRS